MRISDWSSDVCSSDLLAVHRLQRGDEAAALLVDARRALGDLRGVFLDAADGLADGAHHLADGLRAAAHGFRAAGGLVALGDELLGLLGQALSRGVDLRGGAVGLRLHALPPAPHLRYPLSAAPPPPRP